MKRLAFLMLALLLSTQAWASPNTPGAATSLQIQPYENAFGNSTTFVTAMGDMGYSIREGRNTPGPTAPDFGIDDYVGYLGQGYGHIWIETHGNTDGHSIESYDNATARDNNWNFYLAHGWSTDHIYRGNNADGYGIGLKAAGVQAQFSSNYSTILNNSCGSGSYSASWTGHRTYIGSSSADGCSAEDNFYTAIGGGATFASSIYGTMALSGNGDTILAASVTGESFDFLDLIPESGLDVTFNFDGACTGNIIVNSGPAYVCNQSWSGDNQYTAHICPVPGQSGQVWLGNGFTSGNGIPARHATNTWSLLVGSNSAADVSFGVRNDTAIWRVGSEYNTVAYLVEAATTMEGPWQQVGTEHNPGFMEYELDVSAAIAEGKQWFRLIEREESGHRIIHGYSQPSTPRAQPQMLENPPTLEEFAQAIAEHQAARENELPSGLPMNVGDGQSLAIYTIPAFAAAVDAYYASYWRSYGYTVTVETVPGRPQTAAEEDAQVAYLQSRIATNTAAGVKYHELWGRDCDYHYLHGERWPAYWTGPWMNIHSQLVNRYLSTANDVIIPAPTVRDDLPRGQNLSYWWPYFRSDKAYQVPGAVVTRIPVEELWQIVAYSLVIQETNDWWSPSNYGLSIGLFVGDLDHMGEGDGAQALTAANLVRAMLLQQGHWISEIYESEVPNPETRNRVLADQWNGGIGGRTNLNIMYASQSGPHYPGNMYSKRELGDDVWRMDLVFPYLNHHPFFLAPTCGTAASWATDDAWYYHTPVAMDMLFHEAGSSGYYGPGCGSVTSLNQDIGYEVTSRVVEDFSRPTFESIAIAEEEIAALYSGNPLILRQLQTMSKLGSALTRIGPVDAIVGVDDEVPHSTQLLGNYPNPFNPQTKINFYLEHPGHVSLKIFDLRGALVATLADENLSAGFQHRIWNGTNDHGQSIASGTYFYRLEAGDKSVSRKMLLLK